MLYYLQVKTVLVGKTAGKGGVNLSITSDTTATVELTASNFVWAKDLEVNPEVTDEMRFFFNMVKRGNKWLIRMDNLLQSGK